MKIIVLNDGETWSSVGGCKLIEIDEITSTDPDLDYYIEEACMDGAKVEGVKVIATLNNNGVYCK